MGALAGVAGATPDAAEVLPDAEAVGRVEARGHLRGQGWRRQQAERVELGIAALRARPRDPPPEFRGRGLRIGGEVGRGGDRQLFLALDRELDRRPDRLRALRECRPRRARVVPCDGVCAEHRGDRAEHHAECRHRCPCAPATCAARAASVRLGRRISRLSSALVGDGRLAGVAGLPTIGVGECLGAGWSALVVWHGGLGGAHRAAHVRSREGLIGHNHGCLSGLATYFDK